MRTSSPSSKQDLEAVQSQLGGAMKFICFGYYDEKKWNTMSEGEQNAFMDECFAYGDVLRNNGHTTGSEIGAALQSARNSTTLRLQKRKVIVTDGPYAETKEQVGGFFLLEAKDMNQAIELMSKHPGLKVGPFEIRPVEDMTEAIRGSERRRHPAREKPGT
jgi:hypothetical protein